MRFFTLGRFCWAIVLTCLLSNWASAQAPDAGIKFVDAPLPKQSSTRAATTKVDHIVLHFCSGINVDPENPFKINDQLDIFRKANASANYLIDRDGTVYRLVPETRTAWHAGNGHLADEPDIKSMNSRAIGIEMFAIGSPADMKLFGITQAKYDAIKAKHPEWIGFSDAQYATLNKLIGGIISRNPAIAHDRKHIIGHEEWAGRARRTDPGQLFDWTKIGLTKERPAN